MIIQQACRAGRLGVTSKTGKTEAPNGSMQRCGHRTRLAHMLLYITCYPNNGSIAILANVATLLLSSSPVNEVFGHLFYKNGAYREDKLDPKKNFVTAQMISCMELILRLEAEISTGDFEGISRSLFANDKPRLLRLTKYDHLRMTFRNLGDTFGAAFLQEAVVTCILKMTVDSECCHPLPTPIGTLYIIVSMLFRLGARVNEKECNDPRKSNPFVLHARLGLLSCS